jgi:hypothetical protein
LQGLAEFRTVSGVGGGDTPSSSSSSQPPAPPGPPGVGCQAGKLPELVIRGQAGSDPSTQGSLQLKGVRALFNRAGGLDISLYSAGMVCADLLSRMQVGSLGGGVECAAGGGGHQPVQCRDGVCGPTVENAGGWVFLVARGGGDIAIGVGGGGLDMAWYSAMTSSLECMWVFGAWGGG